MPLRYEDRTQLVAIGALQAGSRCLISGEVLLAETVYRGRRNLLVRIADGSGQLTLRFFHFSRQQQAQFRVGAHVTCFGEARRGSNGFEMIHPEYRVLREDQATTTDDALTAIYPATGRRTARKVAQPYGSGFTTNGGSATAGITARRNNERSWACRRWLMPSTTCIAHRPTRTRHD